MQCKQPIPTAPSCVTGYRCGSERVVHISVAPTAADGLRRALKEADEPDRTARGSLERARGAITFEAGVTTLYTGIAGVVPATRTPSLPSSGCCSWVGRTGWGGRPEAFSGA
jgi:hypothetical protein